jgi:hypothetical protein
MNDRSLRPYGDDKLARADETIGAVLELAEGVSDLGPSRIPTNRARPRKACEQEGREVGHRRRDRSREAPSARSVAHPLAEPASVGWSRHHLSGRPDTFGTSALAKSRLSFRERAPSATACPVLYLAAGGFDEKRTNSLGCCDGRDDLGDGDARWVRGE